MSLYRNLLRGISFNIFGILISRGLSVAVVVMLARILGPEEFGRYSFLLAIAMMMIPLADFGISGALQKYVSYFKENQIDVVIGCGFIIKLCSSFLIAALVLALDYFAGCFRGYGGYIALILFLSSFNLVVMSLNAELKFGQSALAQILMELIFVLMVVGVLVMGWPVTSVLVARGLSYLLIGLPFMIFVAKPKWVVIRDEFDIFYKIIKFGFWATILVFFTVVFSQSGMVILSVLNSYEDAGILKAAVTIPTLIPLVSEIIRKPLFPIISNASRTSDIKHGDQLLTMHKTITRILLLIFLPVLCVGILFARQIITAVFGSQYVDAIYPFRILLIVNVLASITISYYSILYMKDNIKTLVKIGGVSAGITVASNFVLIPHFGLTGSAFAMLMGQVVGTVWIIAAFIKKYGHKHSESAPVANEITFN